MIHHTIPYYLLFVFLWLATAETRAQTPLPSEINADTQLLREHSPYLISGNLTISASASLNIQAGVVLIFGEGASLVNNGRFILQGRKDAYIHLKAEDGKRWRYISNNGSIFANYVHSRNSTRFISCNGDTLSIKNCVVTETTGTIGDDLIAAHHTPYIEIIGCDLFGDPTSSRIDAIDLDGVSMANIAQNSILDFPDDAIDIGSGSTNVTISNNSISNCDMGVSVGESSKASVNHNVVSYCGAGIQSHTNAVVTATHNTFYGNQVGIRALHYDSQPTSYGKAYVSNSIFANCTVATVKLVENSVVTFSHCLSDTEVLEGEGNVLGNPAFVDAANGNFFLGAGSAAIDMGSGENDTDGTRADLGFAARYNSPILIQEICASNLSSHADEAKEYDDWFELYNTTDAPINLRGYFLSDKPGKTNKFELLQDVIIQAHSSLLFWADDSLQQGPTHVSFGLSGAGEYLSVSSPEGLVLDSVTFPTVPVNHTYGRHTESRNWVIYTVPTPGATNYGTSFTAMAGSVNFSHNGGPEASATVNLNAVSTLETARFTTNGATPELGEIAQNDIPVQATTTLRAAATREHWLPGFPQSRLFFTPGSSHLPVLSLSMNEEDLYGTTGIYTNYKNSSIFWERPVSLAYYSPDFEWAANAGIRIQGGNSVFMPKKAFRLFFRAGYGTDQLMHSPFNNGPESFEKLVLRSGYDDDITVTSGTLLRDPLSAELWKKMDEIATKSDFVALYLNNAYWGIYNVRESIDENFIRARLNSEQFDLVRFLKNGSEVKYGSKHDWNALMHYFETTDFTQTGVYDEVASLLDVNSTLNLLAFVHCTAYRSWTWGTFGIKPQNGKWAWTIWDTDRGYSLPSWNGFEEYAYTHAEKWSNILPQKLMLLEPFRHDLINRNCDLLNTLFKPESALAMFDSLAQVIAPEIENEYGKWNPGNAFGWPGKLDNVRNFLQQRPNVLYEQMKSYFSLEDTSHIRVEIEGPGEVQLNSIKISTTGFKGVYMRGVPVQLTAQPQKGAEFVEWKGRGTSPVLEILPEEGSEIIAVFKPSQQGNPEPLVLHEIMYHPLENSGGEWIELYNPNNFTVDIGLWRFTDSGAMNSFVIPQNTTIQPKGYLVLAGDAELFSAHFPEVKNVVGSFNKGTGGFNLSNGGETLYLYTAKGEEEDRVAYLDKDPWPELADGKGPSLQLLSDTDNSFAASWGTNQQPLSTPGSANVFVVSKIEPLAHEPEISVYPNPVNNGWISVQFHTGPATLAHFRVYDLLGKPVFSTQRFLQGNEGQQVLSLQLAHLPQGIYILQVNVLLQGQETRQMQTKIRVE